MAPAEDSDQTTFQGRPLWSAREVRKYAELNRNLLFRKALDKLGRLKVTKNTEGEIINKEGKVLSLSPKLYEYLKDVPVRPPSDSALEQLGPLGGGNFLQRHASSVSQIRELQARSERGDKVAAQLLKEMPFDTATRSGVMLHARDIEPHIARNQELIDRYNAEAAKYNTERAARIAAETPAPYTPQEIESLNQELLSAGVQPVEEAIPYQPYPSLRYEGLTDNQRKLWKEAQDLGVTHPETRERLIEAANAPDTSEIHPYQKRFEAVAAEAEEGLQRRLKNQIDPKFIASGMWRSGKRQSAHEHARSELEKHLAREQAKMESEEYHKYKEQQSKHKEQRAQALRDLANFEQQESKNKLINFDVRQQLANREQQLGQQARDFEHEEHVKAQAYPVEQLQRAVNLSSGYQQNVPTVTDVLRAGSNPAANQPSMSSVLGGMAMSAAPMLSRLGQQQQPGYADGGHILSNAQVSPSQNIVNKKLNSKIAREHSPGIADLFASTPMEMTNPMPTDAQMPMMNTPEMQRYKQHIGNLQGAPKAGLWDFVGGVGAGALGSGGKNTTEMLMGGGKGGYDAYNAALSADEAREDKITNLNKAIQDTRQAQLDREMKYRAAKDQMTFNRLKESARFGLEERKLAQAEKHHRENLSNKAELLYAKNAPQSIDIGDTEINPKRKIGLTPQDRLLLKQNEKLKEEYKDKGKGSKHMLSFLKEHQQDLPSTGYFAKYTPNLSDKSREYYRHLEEMVQGETGGGPLTGAKLTFAHGLKPTELDAPEKVGEFAKRSDDFYQNKIDKIEAEELFSSYDIPPRVTGAAYEMWRKDGKKGNLVNYVKGILEGTIAVDFKSESESEPEQAAETQAVSKSFNPKKHTKDQIRSMLQSGQISVSDLQGAA